jgi:thioredoxin reductase (NADPH)
MEEINIAVIGAGPAGIAVAVESKVAGMENIVILESKNRICDVIHTYYHEGKRVDPIFKKVKIDPIGVLSFETETKEEFIERMEEIVKKYNLDIRFNNEVYKILPVQDKFKIITSKGVEYLAQFVVIAIGIFGKPTKPSYPIPSAIKDKVLFSAPKTPPENKKILVVGGGDSAIETACFLSEKNNVTLAYRKAEFFRINEINACGIRDCTCQGSVSLYMSTDIEAIEPSGDDVLVKFKEKPHETFEQVFYCLGGMSPQALLEGVGIEFKDSKPVVDEFGETNVNRVFLSGDLAVDKGTIMAAFNTGKKVVEGILKK